jgi:iron complex transport system ATP-binding protein
VSTLLAAKKLAIGYHQPRFPEVIVGSNISLELHPGELVCLLGPNGVGKSTLIRTMVAMQPALDGVVTLMGESISELHPKELARKISVVLTDRVGVGNMTAYSLVALGRHPYTDWMGRLASNDEQIVQQAIEAVGAVSLASRKVNELSDGERQKVMIARALAQEPAVMVLDEPTAFLDLPHRANVMRILRNLAHDTDRAILLSTHDLDMALRSADRIWLMDHDGSLCVGAPEDLILNGAFQRLFCDEEVEFDIFSGSFKFISGQGELVEVVGEEIPTLWTERALIRAGFEVAKNNHARKARLKVNVTETNNHFQWQAETDDGSTDHDSIHGLINWLSRFPK